MLCMCQEREIMPRYSALLTIDAEMSANNPDGSAIQGFAVSIEYYAKDDTDAERTAWITLSNSDFYRNEMLGYVIELNHVEVSELARIDGFGDLGTKIGQIVFFSE
jgi:hypothetical protein